MRSESLAEASVWVRFAIVVRTPWRGGGGAEPRCFTGRPWYTCYMGTQNSIADYVALVQRLRRLEATKRSTLKTLGYLPDGLYGTFSGVSRADRRAIVLCYRRGVTQIGTWIAAAVLTMATIVTALLGLGVSTPLAAVAVSAVAYATVADFVYLGPLSSLTKIKRVMYGFPTKASCARREADEAAWRDRMQRRQVQSWSQIESQSS